MPKKFEMVLKSIEIKNFRNHIHTKLEFSENLNLFVGGNAQGKTSILEAISYLCLTKISDKIQVIRNLKL